MYQVIYQTRHINFNIKIESHALRDYWKFFLNPDIDNKITKKFSVIKIIFRMNEEFQIVDSFYFPRITEENIEFSPTAGSHWCFTCIVKLWWTKLEYSVWFCPAAGEAMFEHPRKLPPTHFVLGHKKSYAKIYPWIGVEWFIDLIEWEFRCQGFEWENFKYFIGNTAPNPVLLSQRGSSFVGQWMGGELVSRVNFSQANFWQIKSCHFDRCDRFLKKATVRSFEGKPFCKFLIGEM